MNTKQNNKKTLVSLMLGHRIAQSIYAVTKLSIPDIDAAKNLRFLGRGVFVIDIGLGIADTIEAYREGKDWIKEAIKEGADILSYYAVYTAMGIALVALGLTPVGWVALGGITAAGSMELNKLVINPYIENNVHI